MMTSSLLIAITTGLFPLLAAGQRGSAVQDEMRPASPPTATTAPETQPPPSADEAVRRCTALLDRLEDETDAGAVGEGLAEAVRLVDVIAEQDPVNAWLDNLQGRIYARSGKPGEAISRLRKFVLSPQGRSDWRSFGMLGDLFSREFPRLARSYYKKASALNPREPSVMFGLSLCASKLGELPLAIDLAQEAVVADGRQTIRYLSHLALMLRATGQWTAALREVHASLALAQKQVEEAPGQEAPLRGLGVQYQLLTNVLQARINESSEFDAELYLQWAAAVRQQTNIAGKLSGHNIARILERAVEQSGDEPSLKLLEQYGLALAEIDQVAKAISTFEQILERDPDNTTAREWLERLRTPD